MIKFNNHNLLDIFDKIKAIRRDVLPPRTMKTLEVPNRDGSHLFSVRNESRFVEVDVMIKDKTFEKLRDRLEVAAGKLRTEKVAPLEIFDEPNRLRYAILVDQTPIDEINKQGKITLVFFMPDPVKFGEQKSIRLDQKGMMSNLLAESQGAITIINSGTAPAFPKYICTFDEPATFLSLVTPDKYLMLGYPVDVDSIQFEPEEIVMDNTMSTLVGWTEGVQVDGGTIQGEMASEGSSFVAKEYGDGNRWHGPARKTSLPEALQDFEIEAEIELLNRQAQVGRVEIYLLDVNNEMIGKMAMKDAWANTTQNRGEMRLGPFDNDEYFIVHPDYAGAWNDFKGILRLTRVGNRWRAYIAKVNEDGTHHARHTSPYYVDLEEKYMDRLAQVQVHLGTSGEYEPATKRVSRIKVKKINQPGSQEIPYIAHPGDVIEIDTHTHRINKNGEPQQWLWDPAGDWIPLKPGKTELAVHPQTVRVKASYQSRWY